MNNITQITNYDIINIPEMPNPDYVLAGGDTGSVKAVYYKILSPSILKNSIVKFGYCCEPKAMQYPIFLTINGAEEKFYIGKTGMFELQPETWKNVNDPDLEEQISNVIVTQIRIPWRWKEEEIEDLSTYKGYNFKLDYIYSIN